MNKKDIIIPERGCDSPILQGSKVVFIDGSFTLSLINGKLEHTCLGLSGSIFTVVAVNIPCPTERNVTDSLILQNNCIVFNPKDNTYHFCSRQCIQNILHLGDTEPKLR